MKSDDIVASAEPTLLMVVNEDRFFISHRLEIGRAALEAGWRVVVVSASTGREGEIQQEGMEFIAMPVEATAVDMRSNVRLIMFLAGVYRKFRGALIHMVGMKLILFGNIAARLARVKSPIVNAVSGLGIFFLNPETLKARMALKTLRMLRPRSSATYVFQNHDDEVIFRKAGLLKGRSVELLKGSGVDLRKYSFEEIPDAEPDIVIFTGRLLRSKGVPEFIAAAEKLRPRWEGRAEFRICGELSRNADGLSAEEMARLTDGEYIRWLGHVKDVPAQLRKACMMVFPSYYREGMPLSLLEASAIGRAVITCDSVGCRDCVEPGVNGYLVRPRDAEAIALHIEELLLDRGKLRRMGRESRRIAERDYDRRAVVRRHMEIYRRLSQKHTET